MRRKAFVGFAALLGGLSVMAGACSSTEAKDRAGDDDAGTPSFLDPAAGPGCGVAAIMNARCTSCHGDPPREGAPMSLTSLATLRAPSSLDPTKTTAERCLARMKSGNMPPPPAEGATPAEIATLESWIGQGMPECAADAPKVPSEAHPNQIPQDELFKCDPNAPGASPSRLHRVDQREWRFSLRNDLNGLGWAVENPFYPNGADQYGTYTSIESIDDPTLGLYLDPNFAGSKLGLEVHNALKGLAATQPKIKCLLNDAKPTAACVHDFVPELLGRHVLFRPPTTDEAARLEAFATSTLAAEASIADRPHSVAVIATAAWLTSGALFRNELGGAPDANGRSRLTDAELAQALAYAIGDRGPRTPPSRYSDGTTSVYTAPVADGSMADIAAAAEQGTIGDPTKLDALFRAHAGGVDLDRFDLAPDIGRPTERQTHGQWWLSDKMRGFFRQWLGYEAFATVFKDQPGRTSQFDADKSIYSVTTTSYRQLQSPYYKDGAFEDSMIEQLDDLIARLVVEDQNVLENLLTTRQVYVNGTSQVFLALQGTQRPYGLTTSVPKTRDGRWITLPANERAGVLTHPGWLAAHGGNLDDDPSLIHRGHWIRENLLCQYVPPLSEVKVPAMVGPSAPDKTARERVQEATASATCQGCHRLMNTLGEPFEIYNHAGFLRAFDHDGSPPNGATTLVDMPDPALNGSVKDAVELTQKLAKSSWVKRCFIRQTFRYVVGRNETRADACSLVKMEQAYDAKGSVMSLWSAAITSDAFLYRRAGGK